MKRILIVCHNYFPAIGGAERLFQDIAENLANRGNSVTVLTSNAKDCAEYLSESPRIVGQENEIINGVEIIRAPINNRMQAIAIKVAKILMKGDKKRGRHSKIFDSLTPLIVGPHMASSAMKLIFRSPKFSHVICGPFPTSAPLYGKLLSAIQRSKLVLIPCMHIEDRTHNIRINRMLAKAADRIITLTKDETEQFGKWKIDRKRIDEFGVGVAEPQQSLIVPDSLKAAIPCEYILYFGQEVEHKNIEMLIDAMVNIWDNGIFKQLIISGSRTNYSNNIDIKIDSLDPEYKKRIIRLANASEVEKWWLLNNCEALVLPSSFESFGIVVVEAWICKKPVIVSDIPGLRSLVDDRKDGLLFVEGSTIDLAARVRDLVLDQTLRLRLGLAGYTKVIDKFGWNSIIARLEAHTLQ